MNDLNLSRNLAALSAHQALPVDRLAAASGDVRIDTSTGAATLLLRRSQSWIAMNSRRDPVTEADRWLDDTLPDAAASTVIVIGAGLGYVLDAIDRRNAGTRVVAVEPTAACARALLEHRDWSERVEAGRLRLLVGPDFGGTDDLLWMLEGTQDPPVVAHPMLSHELPEAMADAARAAARAVYAAQANRAARLANAGRYLTNTLRNAPTLAAAGDVAHLAGLFSGVPAVVISAGPSLDASIDDLRALGHHALLIAVDTALRPLLAAGITPHLVVGLDPSRANAEHLRDLPDPSAVYLVAEGSLHPAAFDAFGGRTFVFRVSDHHPWPWLTSLGSARGQLQVWGSVATAALDLSRRLDCNPIVFCGQDLAYTGGRSYCTGTTWERSGIRPGKRAEIAAVDIHGRRTTTADHLVSFRDWLVEQSRRDSRRYINASEGGILHGGRIELLSLPHALSTAARLDDVGIRDRLRAAHAGGGSAAQVRAACTRLAGALHQNAAGCPEPVASWVAFAGATVTPDAIARALTARYAPSPVVTAPRRLDSQAPAVLGPADLAHLAALTANDARDDVKVLHVRPEPGLVDTDLQPALERAVTDVPTGGMLVVVDCTDRLSGTGVRRAIGSLLARHEDLVNVRPATLDWLSRLTVIRRMPCHDVPPFAVSHADATALAELVVRALAPTSVTSVGPHAEVWLDAFSGYAGVRATHGEPRYDVVVAMRTLLDAAPADYERLLSELVALGDVIVLAIPTRGFERQPYRNLRSMSDWAELLLTLGYALSDELRPLVEDRGDFSDRSYEFHLLHVARRIASPGARAALAASDELRRLIVNGLRRNDDLFVQATALRMEYRDSGGASRGRAGATAEVTLDSDDFEHAGGHCFVLRLDDAALRAAQRRGLLRHATIDEDGRALPQAHMLATEIQAAGGGRYCVWTDAIYLSASDNTDPRINGRRYTLRISDDAALLVGR